MIQILHGDCREVLKTMPDESIHCCVTSPPYWGLRDYGLEPVVWGGLPECEHEWGDIGKSAQRLRNGVGSDTAKQAFAETLHPQTGSFCRHCNAWRGCLGLEPTPQLYVEHMVEVFREVRRVLRGDGTLWLNLGDSYNTAPPGNKGRCEGISSSASENGKAERRSGCRSIGLKYKDLCGIPWRVAFALQADGWYLRSEIIWSKPNPMPESVKDRPTKAHEQIFLLAKSERYFFNQEAVAEKASYGEPNAPGRISSPYGQGFTRRAVIATTEKAKARENGSAPYRPNTQETGGVASLKEWRNIRSVWNVATQPYPEAHFATFPEDIAKRCILAGCPEGGTVLDPFAGSGTVGQVAESLQCKAILIEAQQSYIPLIERRCAQVGLPI